MGSALSIVQVDEFSLLWNSIPRSQTLISKDYLPILQTLVGGFLTFLGGFLGNFLIQQQQRRSERKNLASAFYGEIKALVRIVERRRYVQGIKDRIKVLEKGGETKFKVRVEQKYFNVYDKNLDKIGILPEPLPEEIVDLYTVMTSILEDLATLNESSIYEGDPEIIIKHLVELQSLFEYMIESGYKICKKIRNMKLLKE